MSAMAIWAEIAEWVKGSTTSSTEKQTLSKPHPSTERNFNPSLNGIDVTQTAVYDDPTPLSFKTIWDRKQRKLLRKLKKRERYRDSLTRGLRLGHEITLENEDVDTTTGRHWTVTYKAPPSRNKELQVNIPQEESIRISWTSEHKGDTALVAYNYNTFLGHNANWMISGSGGPASITSRGELSERDFEQENDLTVRSDIRSHPIETDLKAAIRINYLTDNVDLRWKGAVKYPIFNNKLSISHGIERQELFGCCWTVKAEKNTEKLPWRTVRMETKGSVTQQAPRIEHVKTEFIRKLTGTYDLEFEAKTPITHRGTKWTSRIKHKNRGVECVAFVEGEDLQFRSVNLSCDCESIKTANISCSAGFRPETGWSLSTALKLGQEKQVSTQEWHLRGEVKIAEGLRPSQANLDIFVPLGMPFLFH